MPIRPLKMCGEAGCKELVRVGVRFCHQHTRDYNRKYDDKQARPWSSWYSHAQWRSDRSSYLSHNPVCIECEKHGKLIPATVVDHIVNHKGDRKLFWDSSNWQSLCKSCHDRKTATYDGGFKNKNISDG